MSQPAQRPSTRTFHPSQPALPASADAAPRQFPDAASALGTLLQRAADLAAEGAEPRLPVQRYLEALGPVLRFVATQPLLHDELSLSREICGAALRIAEELLGRPASAEALSEPLAVPLPRTPQHEEALRTGVLLLNAYRAALDVALGRSSRAEDRAARAELAVTESVSLRDADQLIDRIERFVLAAERWPEALRRARLAQAQVLGLCAHARVLRRHEDERRQKAVTAGAPQRTRTLHLALEYFFDRYSAAVCVRLIGQPATQRTGLSLVPKAAPARSPSPSPPSSGSGRVKPAAQVTSVSSVSSMSGLARSALARALDYAMCQVTRSGRLVFT
jgi:hypothetical protein